MRVKGRILTTALSLALLCQLLASHVVAADYDDKLLFYDEQTGEGGVGYLSGGAYQNLSSFWPGAFSLNWTQVADGGFFYREQTGEAAKVRIGSGTDGSVSTLWIKNGFAPWSTITYHEGYLLFYQKANGSAVIGKATDNGFENVVVYPPGSFGRWSHIISTQKGIFFYDDETGSGAMGKFVYHRGAIGLPYVIGFTTLRGYPANYFSPGYTSIAYMPNGLLLYNKYVGLCALAKVWDDGEIAHVNYGGWPQIIGAGYSHVVTIGRKLFTYNKDTGAARVGEMIREDNSVPPLLRNFLYATSIYPAGTFKTGWSHITVQRTPGS